MADDKTQKRTLLAANAAVDDWAVGTVQLAISGNIDHDFHGWLLDQAASLRRRNVPALDWDNLAEELEAEGGSQRSELKSRLYILLLHLLKWQTQPDEREYNGRSWILSTREARRRITDLLKYSPSLKHYLPDLLAEAWEWARDDALLYLDDPSGSCPTTCPWPYDTLMERDFLPPDPVNDP
jgi:hypothetical protein